MQDFREWLKAKVQTRLRQLAKGEETNRFTEYATLIEILNKLKEKNK